MRKPLIRIAAGLLGGLLAALAVAPAGLAFADTTATDVVALDEAWFFRYRQPLEPVPAEVGGVAIDDPSGNQADDIVKSEIRNRTNPYPGDTLHVGVNAGQPEAVFFLAWDLLALNGNNGLTAIVTGGTVTFTDAGSTCLSQVPENAPEDARPGRNCGSRNVEDADMVACVATSLVVETQGGDWKDVYPYDKEECAPLEPVTVKEGEPAQWTVSLDSFADTWSDPFANNGIAIVPNPETIKPANEDAGVAEPAPTEWHVAFHGRRTDVKNAALVTSDLQIEKQKLPVFGPIGGPIGGGSGGTPTYIPPAPTDTGSTGSSGYTPAAPTTGGTSTYTPGTTTPGTTTPGTTVPGAAPVAEVAPPAAAPPLAAAPVTQPVNASGGKLPPAIWLLPLLGLSVAGALGWSLTQPVELAAEREGAVSKLMKARRLGRASA
jgi:hypothetical protein